MRSILFVIGAFFVGGICGGIVGIFLFNDISNNTRNLQVKLANAQPQLNASKEEPKNEPSKTPKNKPSKTLKNESSTLKNESFKAPKNFKLFRIVIDVLLKQSHTKLYAREQSEKIAGTIRCVSGVEDSQLVGIKGIFIHKGKPCEENLYP